MIGEPPGSPLLFKRVIILLPFFLQFFTVQASLFLKWSYLSTKIGKFIQIITPFIRIQIAMMNKITK